MSATPASTTSRFGRYELDRRLAIGGMAELFLGHISGPSGFAKRVVVKRVLPDRAVDPAFVRMFLDEARLAARFNHPNLVQVFELVEEAGRYGLVMEYIEGYDLGQIIRERLAYQSPIPFEVALRLVAGAAEGLHYAHELREPDGTPLSVVHRDISPANVLVTRAGTVKVVDFGIAKHTTTSQDTQQGIIKGKYSYMSPEQVRGERLDRRSDLFALGTVLYELLALSPCFTRGSTLETMRAVATVDCRPLTMFRADTPPGVLAAIEHLHAKRPERRPANAAELAELLLAPSTFPRACSNTAVAQFLRDTFKETEQSEVSTFAPLADDDFVAVDESHASPTTVLTRAEREALMEQNARRPTRDLGRPSATAELTPPPPTAAPLETDTARHASLETLERASETAWDLGPSRTIILRGAGAHRAGRPGGQPGTRTGETEPHGVVGSNGRAEAPRRRLAWPISLMVASFLVLAVAAALVRPAGETQDPPEPSPPKVASTPGPIENSGAPGVDAEPLDAVAGLPPLVEPTPATAEPVTQERSPESGTPRARPELGSLSVKTTPAAEILVDGRSLGRGAATVAKLSPGTHRLTVRNLALGLEQTETIRVRGGEKVVRDLRFDLGRVAFKVTPWAQVVLSGRPLGTTPLAPIELVAGVHELQLVNPELGVQRRVRVEVVVGKTAKVIEDLSP